MATETAASGTSRRESPQAPGGDRHRRERDVGCGRRLGDRRDEAERQREERENTAKVVSVRTNRERTLQPHADCTARLPVRRPPLGGAAPSDLGFATAALVILPRLESRVTAVRLRSRMKFGLCAGCA